MMLEGSRSGARSAALSALLFATFVGCGGDGAGDAAGTQTARSNPPRATAEIQSSESGATTLPVATPARGTAWVIFGTGPDADTVVAEVAQTAAERARGLMYREELGENEGMLFVFQDVAERAFWMRDTFIPLDIAYMDPSFRIIDIKPMEPESEALVESSGPAQYALEVNRGWFAEHGVEVGATPRITFGM